MTRGSSRASSSQASVGGRGGVPAGGCPEVIVGHRPTDPGLRLSLPWAGFAGLAAAWAFSAACVPSVLEQLPSNVDYVMLMTLVAESAERVGADEIETLSPLWKAGSVETSMRPDRPVYVVGYSQRAVGLVGRAHAPIEVHVLTGPEAALGPAAYVGRAAGELLEEVSLELPLFGGQGLSDRCPWARSDRGKFAAKCGEKACEEELTLEDCGFSATGGSCGLPGFTGVFERPRASRVYKVSGGDCEGVGDHGTLEVSCGSMRCTLEVHRCGDGEESPAEECDDGNEVDGDGCDTNCRRTGCGNGVVAGAEGCEDGNESDGDGCDSGCKVEPGWVCRNDTCVPTCETCGGPMVVVPEGAFLMGCRRPPDTQCDDDEAFPARAISVSEFSFDETEVTVEAYQGCVSSGACEDPGTVGSCNWGVSGREQHPVNCVGWFGATQYCAWVGRRLPTEAEWEKAARGPDGRVYPWGNTPEASCAHVVMDDTGSGGAGCGRLGTWEVKSRAKGQSPYGAYDVIGNVWEWVSDWYDPDYTETSTGDNPPGPVGGDFRVLRGGSWDDDNSKYLRASDRGRGAPGNRLDLVGFRCARPSEP